jgi:hypothetical protein
MISFYDVTMLISVGLTTLYGLFFFIAWSYNVGMLTTLATGLIFVMSICFTIAWGFRGRREMVKVGD